MIVFSSRVGVAVHGAADYISGVHVLGAAEHEGLGSRAAATTAGHRRRRRRGFRSDAEPVAERLRMPPTARTTASGILLKGDKIGPGFHRSSRIRRRHLRPVVDSAQRQLPGAASTFRRRPRRSDWATAARRRSTTARQRAAAIDRCTVYQFCGAGGACDATDAAVLGRRPRRHVGDSSAKGGAVPSPPVTTKACASSTTRCAQALGTRAQRRGERRHAGISTFATRCLPVDRRRPRPRRRRERLPGGRARPPDAAGRRVTVETDAPVTGTVTVDVDSSAPSVQ